MFGRNAERVSEHGGVSRESGVAENAEGAREGEEANTRQAEEAIHDSGAKGTASREAPEKLPAPETESCKCSFSLSIHSSSSIS